MKEKEREKRKRKKNERERERERKRKKRRGRERGEAKNVKPMAKIRSCFLLRHRSEKKSHIFQSCDD